MPGQMLQRQMLLCQIRSRTEWSLTPVERTNSSARSRCRRQCAAAAAASFFLIRSISRRCARCASPYALTVAGEPAVAVTDSRVDLSMIDLSIDTSTMKVWLPDASTTAASNSPCLTMRSWRSEEHTSELQSQFHLVCRLLL